MPTAYRRLAETRRSRRFHVVAGRPIGDVYSPTCRVDLSDARCSPLEHDEGKTLAGCIARVSNPWSDAASDERLLAAAFADRVVLFACIAIGVLMLADFVAPDLAAWIVGHPAVVVAR